MIILRLGGVYADIDTECRKPLSQLIQPRDTMVVSWENEFPTAEEASRRQYVRKRQVQHRHFVFCVAPMDCCAWVMALGCSLSSYFIAFIGALQYH